MYHWKAFALSRGCVVKIDPFVFGGLIFLLLKKPQYKIYCMKEDLRQDTNNVFSFLTLSSKSIWAAPDTNTLQQNDNYWELKKRNTWLKSKTACLPLPPLPSPPPCCSHDTQNPGESLTNNASSSVHVLLIILCVCYCLALLGFWILQQSSPVS